MTSDTDTSSAGSAPARILVVDDHPIVRDGLVEMIERQPDVTVCGQASSAAEAMELVDKSHPDLVIADIFLTGSNGLDLTRQLKRLYPQIRVLVVSMHDEDVYALRALRAGADGYVMKQVASRQILAALREVLAGGTFMSEAVRARMSELDVHNPEELARSPLDALSDRELEIFEMLGRGASRRQVAKKMGISVKTVEAHRHHIRQKLAIPSATELRRQASMWIEGQT